METFTWIFGVVFVFIWMWWIVLKFIDHNKPDIPGLYPHHRKKKKRSKTQRRK